MTGNSWGVEDKIFI